jgi:uncharacterized protein YrrD
MRLAKGADVYSGDGEKLGVLDRVILDPNTKEVTHLVVSKGFLFTTNKIVAIDELDENAADSITLRSPKRDLKDFQDFEETHYVNLEQAENPTSDETPAPVSYWYPPLNMVWWRAGGTDNPVMYPGQPAYVARKTQNIPEGTVALEEGAKVVSADHKHIGNIKELIINAPENRVTHIVLNEGVLFKERKLVPVTWISEIDEGEIRLSVDSQVLDRLPAYQTVH